MTKWEGRRKKIYKSLFTFTQYGSIIDLRTTDLRKRERERETKLKRSSDCRSKQIKKKKKNKNRRIWSSVFRSSRTWNACDNSAFAIVDYTLLNVCCLKYSFNYATFLSKRERERERKELSKIEIAEENGNHGNRKKKSNKKMHVCVHIN